MRTASTPYGCAACAKALVDTPRSLCLGTREFEGDVPLQSRIWNAMIRQIFRFFVGRPLTDTQTGLRGIPAGFLKKCFVYR
ncbi:MAG: hypothetical protein ACUVQ6_01715 [Dissulfurimicrobium sp.]|uniref:hypothetical protein n=1 Tax=Dissulfurimicrobium sp. TaxID=2022436 RepID=UPI004049B445